MTELETMQWVKMYMDKLARGIDPVINQEIPKEMAELWEKAQTQSPKERSE